MPLGDLGEVRLEPGAAYIYRENSQRFIPLKYSVRERDLGSTVAEAQERIGKTVPVPQGYCMEWSGEFGALQEAKQRLLLIVPLSLLLILMLLYSLFNSVRDSLLALSGIPFAVAGGIWGLYVAGLHFSVSAAVGFISLFGVAAMDGILLVSYIRKNLEEQGMSSEQAIIAAGETRMRQIFMTGLSACIGLVPAAVSTGIGSQVQQPLACVIVGGMLLSPFCSLTGHPGAVPPVPARTEGNADRRRARARGACGRKSRRLKPAALRGRHRVYAWRMNLHALLLQREIAGRPVRVGVIGAGKFGTMFLAQARLTQGLHVVAVADLNVAAREKPACRCRMARGAVRSGFARRSDDDARDARHRRTPRR